MEFVKIAEDVLYEDGELVMVPALDADGDQIQGPAGVVMKPKADPKGARVYESAETFKTAPNLSGAFRSLKGTVESVGWSKDTGKVTVRVRGKK